MFTFKYRLKELAKFDNAQLLNIVQDHYSLLEEKAATFILSKRLYKTRAEIHKTVIEFAANYKTEMFLVYALKNPCKGYILTASPSLVAHVKEYFLILVSNNVLNALVKRDISITEEQFAFLTKLAELRSTNVA